MPTLRLVSEVEPGTSEADAAREEQRQIELAQRDARAFEPLYRAHYPGVLRYLCRRLACVHAAEDAAAETFVSALRGLKAYRPGHVPLRLWLLKIATNAANLHLRRAGTAEAKV